MKRIMVATAAALLAQSTALQLVGMTAVLGDHQRRGHQRQRSARRGRPRNKLGFDLSVSESDAEAVYAAYLGAPRDGERSMVPYKDCIS